MPSTTAMAIHMPIDARRPAGQPALLRRTSVSRSALELEIARREARPDCTERNRPTPTWLPMALSRGRPPAWSDGFCVWPVTPMRGLLAEEHLAPRGTGAGRGPPDRSSRPRPSGSTSGRPSAAWPWPASARPAGPASGPSCRRCRWDRGRACTSGTKAKPTRSSGQDRHAEPDQRVEDAGPAQLVGVLGRGGGVDVGQGDPQGAVEVGRALLSSGSMSLSKTAWRSALVMKAALKPSPA